MQTQKMSLANIKGKLSRIEMKNIMAGSDTVVCAGNSDCAIGYVCRINAVTGVKRCVRGLIG